MLSDEEIEKLHLLVNKTRQEGCYDLLLDAIGVPTLQQLNIIAARATLSRLVITHDFRFLLADYNLEVELSPIHKALYIFFLKHAEGVEFKHMVDYREELISIYKMMSNRVSEDILLNSVDRLVNPLDNAINEKCARIKAAFAKCMDQYQLGYYIISGSKRKVVDGMSKIWFERKKNICLPRELVSFEFETKISQEV